MNEKRTMTLKDRWLEASAERTNFYEANVDNWTKEVAVAYSELAERSDRLYYDYLASATGRPSGLLSSAINDRIHSVRD